LQLPPPFSQHPQTALASYAYLKLFSVSQGSYFELGAILTPRVLVLSSFFRLVFRPIPRFSLRRYYLALLPLAVPYLPS